MTKDEFAISAAQLIATLQEQRAMRLKGGLYHLNQIEMAYNTNRIEGSQLSEEQTRYIYETRTISGEALSVDDITETNNHFRAFDTMIDNYREPITAETMKEYHRILKQGTSDAAKPWFAVGDWKQVPNAVGGRDTCPPDQVANAISTLLRKTPREMSFRDICDFHYRFEIIHPFQDGNGRVGRLLMFQQCMSNNIMPFIVLDRKKEFYYRGLSNYEKEPGFLIDTFRTFQDAYYAKYAKFVPLLPNDSPSGSVEPASIKQLNSDTEIAAVEVNQ